ncbi:MAG: hypothetical protein ACRC2T_06085 [Thermoguttaceae bacterium]
MKRIFFILVTLNIALIGAMPFLYPAKGVAHFNEAGEINGWQPVLPLMVILGYTNMFVCGMFWIGDYVTQISPAYGFNVPNAEYWKREENLPELRRRGSALCYEIGIYALIFMTIIEVLTICSSRAENYFWFDISIMPTFVLGIVLAFLPLIRIFWIFRLPKNERWVAKTGPMNKL